MGTGFLVIAVIGVLGTSAFFHETHYTSTNLDDVIHSPLVVNCTEPICIGPLANIYCYGDIITSAWQFGVYSWCPGTKLLHDPDVVTANFKKLSYPLYKDVFIKFCTENFANVSYLDHIVPVDWSSEPAFVKEIKDTNLKNLALEINVRWKQLLRKFTPDVFAKPELYPVLPVKNPFMVPGGFFQMYFYWDTFWIMKGMLLSGMFETSRGMLDNFAEVIDYNGFIPNSGAVQHSRRSQPPLFIQMVIDYMDHTGSIIDLKRWMPYMEQEMAFWLNNRSLNVTRTSDKDSFMFIYNAPPNCPRPENYLSDHDFGMMGGNPTATWKGIVSACESGWDFSSRWFDHNGSKAFQKSTIHTDRILPVDLNVFMALNFRSMAHFNKLLKNESREQYYEKKFAGLKGSINRVMYNKTLGSWFDVELATMEHRTRFYPSNVYPLMLGGNTKDELTAMKTYLKNSSALNYPGGVPATNPENSKEQWDFPNLWAPNQHLFIISLTTSGDAELMEGARSQAAKFVAQVYNGLYSPIAGTTGGLWEKYDARTISGKAGGGGEYPVQEGFGWTNGATLDLIRLLNMGDTAIPMTFDVGAAFGGQPHFSIILAAVCLMIFIAAWFVLCGPLTGKMCPSRRVNRIEDDRDRPLLDNSDSE